MLQRSFILKKGDVYDVKKLTNLNPGQPETTSSHQGFQVGQAENSQV